MKRIRIGWLIDSRNGHGEWWQATRKNISILTSSVESACRQFGYNTHWIECEDSADRNTMDEFRSWYEMRHTIEN